MDECTLIQMFAEAKILEALDHPHIIHLYEFYKTKSKKLVLILEYADGKDLQEIILDKKLTKDYFPEEIVIKWII